MTRYDAFGSYSHAVDWQLAPAVQRALQRLARPWYRPRALRVFRDESSLAVSPHLWASIVSSLDESGWFVVLCSPEAASSEWVGREIEHWLAHNDSEHILLVLTDGELVWNRAGRDFDRARSISLPPALFGRFVDEPRHLDLRWARGEEQLDVRHTRFRSAIAELAAPIHGLARDELDAEDVRQHRRAIRLARGATSTLVLLVVLALTLGGIALQQRGDARNEATLARAQAAIARAQAAIARHEANVSRARELAADAVNATRIGRSDLALLLAVEASRLDANTFVRSALFGAVLDQPALLRQLHGLSNGVTLSAVSSDGRTLAAGDSRGDVMVWDVGSGRPLPHQPVLAGTGYLSGLAFASGDTLLVADREGTGTSSSEIDVWDVRSGHLSRTIDGIANAFGSPATSARASVLATLSPQGADVWDAHTGTRIRTLPATTTTSALALSADGVLIASASIDGDPVHGFVEVVRVWKITTAEQVSSACRANVDGAFVGDQVRMPPDRPYILNFAFDQPGRTITTALSGGTNAVISRCDVSTGRSNTARIDVKTPAGAPVVAISADTTSVATRDVSDGTIQIFDRPSGQTINTTRAPTEGAGTFLPDSVVFAPDGRTFTAAGTTAADVNLWRTRTVDPTLEQQTQPVVVATSGGIVAWDPSGATLAVQPNFAAPLVQIIDRRTGVPAATSLGEPRRCTAPPTPPTVTVWRLPHQHRSASGTCPPAPSTPSISYRPHAAPGFPASPSLPKPQPSPWHVRMDLSPGSTFQQPQRR